VLEGVNSPAGGIEVVGVSDRSYQTLSDHWMVLSASGHGQGDEIMATQIRSARLPAKNSEVRTMNSYLGLLVCTGVCAFSYGAQWGQYRVR